MSVEGKLEDDLKFHNDGSPRRLALSFDLEWKICHEDDDSLSYHHLHRTKDDMGLREFFRRPHKKHRARNDAQSVTDPIDRSQVGLAILPHSEPDLGVGSPTPAPSTSQDQQFNGMRATVPDVIHLTALPLDAENIAPDPTQSTARPGQTERLEPSMPAVRPSAADENKSDWKATTYAATKLAIDMVKESADAFPPLKSVVGGLSAILNHCDVCPVLPHNAAPDICGSS